MSARNKTKMATDKPYRLGVWVGRFDGHWSWSEPATWPQLLVGAAHYKRHTPDAALRAIPADMGWKLPDGD
jgi:hypothetical protein